MVIRDHVDSGLQLCVLAESTQDMSAVNVLVALFSAIKQFLGSNDSVHV